MKLFGSTERRISKHKNSSFSQLLNISPMSHTYTEAFCTECSYIQVWFTDQNSKP